jgi:hypothetical protein
MLNKTLSPLRGRDELKITPSLVHAQCQSPAPEYTATIKISFC